jgi:LGFP repeat
MQLNLQAHFPARHLQKRFRRRIIMPTPTIALKTATTKVNATTITLLVDNAFHTTVDDRISATLSVLGTAKTAIDKKAAAIGAELGAPVSGVEFGAGDGYKRRYKNGVIYFLPPAGPCWLHGGILAEYVALGEEAGLLGYPTTDERATPDNAGRYVHFERGSIYWSYSTGAHEVHGAIRDKWASLGWEHSWLGFPTWGEVNFTDGGRVSQFQNGSIYWWPDTGAVDMGNITVRYKGLYCFGETDELSASDEPYVLFGTVGVPTATGSAPETNLRTQIYDDVDSGDCRPDNIELYRGGPLGILVGFALFEHDEGDPDQYLGLIKDGVDLAGKGVSAGCGAIFGPEAASTCQSLWSDVGPKIVGAINDLINTQDNVIATSSMQITAKDLIRLARTATTNFWGIGYHVESELLSDGDASYKVYFEVTTA